MLLSQANNQSAREEVPHIFCVYRSPLLCPLLSHMNSAHILCSYFFHIYLNILPLMPVSSKRPLSFRLSHHNLVCISLLSHACHMPQPLQPPSFGSTHISIWPGVQIMKLLIMQFSASSYHLFSLNSSPQHPVLKHPWSVCFQNIRDQVSHIHIKKKQKIFRQWAIMYMCIYICVCV
jgi:hypothetical protein